VKAAGLPVQTIPSQNIASTLLSLQRGQTYVATILERNGNQAVVSIGGHRIAAQLIGNFPAAGRIRVHVREATPEQVVLQRAPERPVVLPTPSLLTSASEEILSRIGLPPRPEYMTCLSYILATGQPVTPQSVLDLYEAWLTLAPGQESTLPALAQLQAQGLPMVAETLAASQVWASKGMRITASDLIALGKAFNVLAESLASEPVAKRLRPLPDALRSLARTLLSIPLRYGPDPTLAQRISTIVRTLTTPLEALLARLPAQLSAATPWQEPSIGADGAFPAGAADYAAPQFPGTGHRAAENDSFLQETGRGQQSNSALIRPAETQENPSGEQWLTSGDDRPGLETVVRNPGTLGPSIFALERHIQVQLRRVASALDQLALNMDQLSVDSRHATMEARASLQTVLDSLDATQVANVRSASEELMAPYYMLNIPISWSGNQDHAELKVYYPGSGSRRVDPKNTRVAFRIHVEPIGCVEVDMSILNNILSCQVRTEDPFVNQLALEQTPRLQSSLEKHGYLVRSIRCTTQIRIDEKTSNDAATHAAPQPNILRHVDMVV